MALYAFDGTWNDSSVPEDQRNTKKDTNVHRFRELYDGEVEYVDGIGTRYGLVGKLWGGLTGAGAEARVREGFEALREKFAAGDEVIDVIGYSRGATVARLFAQRIERDYDQIMKNGDSRLEEPPKVRFLGLFDTVASFGVPWTDDEKDFDRLIPGFVENTYHAMALDESRETFGIERCIGDQRKVTEVWFRGGHGDIGGNATFVGKKGEKSNRARSDFALNWMLAKGKACGLPVPAEVGQGEVPNEDAPVTAKGEKIKFGSVGTLSRRIHLGDLVHHSLEKTDLTRGIDGRLLRRIDVAVRIEDAWLERKKEAQLWIPPDSLRSMSDNVTVVLDEEQHPSLVDLGSRRYPFDLPPARTWREWLEQWDLQPKESGFKHADDEGLNEFWAPSEDDRNYAWDVFVELRTRITTELLKDDEGDDKTALTSVYKLFPMNRASAQRHGIGCGNAALLVTSFLNEKIRPFTAKWHLLSESGELKVGVINKAFRKELAELQPTIKRLAEALSQLTDRRL